MSVVEGCVGLGIAPVSVFGAKKVDAEPGLSKPGHTRLAARALTRTFSRKSMIDRPTR
jgi:hypothetical protein